MTHRQFTAWQEWLRQEQDRPSRSDWYAMQTAFWSRINVTREDIQLANMKLAFMPPEPTDDATEQERRDHEMAVSKAAALARVPGLVIEVPAPEVRPGEEWIVEQPDYSIS